MSERSLCVKPLLLRSPVMDSDCSIGKSEGEIDARITDASNFDFMPTIRVRLRPKSTVLWGIFKERKPAKPTASTGFYGAGDGSRAHIRSLGLIIVLTTTVPTTAPYRVLPVA